MNLQEFLQRAIQDSGQWRAAEYPVAGNVSPEHVSAAGPDWRDGPKKGVRIQSDGDATFNIKSLIDGSPIKGRLTPSEAEMVRQNRARLEAVEREEAQRRMLLNNLPKPHPEMTEGPASLASTLSQMAISGAPSSEIAPSRGAAPEMLAPGMETLPSVDGQTPSPSKSLTSSYNPASATNEVIQGYEAQLKNSTDAYERMNLERMIQQEKIIESVRGIEANPETRGPANPFDGEGLQATLKRRLQQAAEGGMAMVSGLPSSTASMELALNKRLMNRPDEHREVLNQTILSAQERLQTATTHYDKLDAIREIEQANVQLGLISGHESAGLISPPIETLGETNSYANAEAVREAGYDAFGRPDPRDESIGGAVANGFGSLAAGAVMALPTMGAATAIAGSGANSEQLYHEAIASGATEDTAQTAARFGAIIGMSEAVPIASALKLLPRGVRNKLTGAVYSRLGAASKAAGSEGAQEAAMTFLNNITALNLYDEERGWAEGVTEAALVGAITGGALGAVAGGDKPNAESGLTPDDAAQLSGALGGGATPLAPVQPNVPEAAHPNTARPVAPAVEADLNRAMTSAPDQPAAPSAAPKPVAETNSMDSNLPAQQPKPMRPGQGPTLGTIKPDEAPTPVDPATTPSVQSAPSAPESHEGGITPPAPAERPRPAVMSGPDQPVAPDVSGQIGDPGFTEAPDRPERPDDFIYDEEGHIQQEPTDEPVEHPTVAENSPIGVSIEDDPKWLASEANRIKTDLENSIAGGLATDTDEYRESAREKSQDYFIAFDKVERSVAERMGVKQEDLPFEASPYQVHALAESRSGAYSEKLDRDYRTPIKDKILSSGLSVGMVDAHLMARHADERDAYIKAKNGTDNGSGFAELRADYESKYQALTPEQKKALDEIATNHDAMIENMIDYRVEQGLISPAAAETWRANFKHYIPLRGEGQPRADGLPGAQPGPTNEAGQADSAVSVGNLGTLGSTYTASGIRGNETEEAFGRRTAAESPLATSFAQAEASLLRSTRNSVGQAIYKMVELAGESEDMRFLQEGENPAGENVVTMKIDGEEKAVVLSPRLSAAVHNMENRDMSAGMRHLNTVSRFMGGMLTRNNPFFGPVNFVRDLQMALANNLGDSDVSLKETAKAVIYTFEAVRVMTRERSRMDDADDRTWSKHLREFHEYGGKTNFLQDPTQRGAKRDLIADTDRSLPAKAKRGADKFVDAWQRPGDVLDNAIRLAQFIAMRESGKAPQVAARAAKEITVNFNRRGSKTQAISAWMMFANPAIQGGHNFLRRLARNPVRHGMVATALAASGAILQDQMLSSLEDDELEVYDNLPDWQRDSNWIIFGARGEDGSRPITMIPKPFVYRLPANVAQWTMAVQRGAMDAKELPRRGFEEMLSQFTPVQFNAESPGESAAMLATPDPFDPFAELLLNRNTFFDSNIEYSNEEQGSRSSQADNLDYPSLGPITKWANEMTGGEGVVGGWADFHPSQIAHLIHSYGGGVTRNADKIMKLLDGRREADLENFPGINRFFDRYTERDAGYRAKDITNSVAEVSKNLQLKINEYYRNGATPEGLAAVEKYIKDHPFEMEASGNDEARIAKLMARDETRIAEGNYNHRYVGYTHEIAGGPAKEVRKINSKFTKARNIIRNKLRNAIQNAGPDADIGAMEDAARERIEIERAKMNKALAERFKVLAALARKHGHVIDK